MASRRAGAQCNLSSMPGATPAQRTSQPTRRAAKARKRRSACSPVTDAAGGRLVGDMASKARPQIIVAADAEALAEIAAERLLARVMPAKERAAVCLTGGPSPEGLYRRLAREPHRSTLPWDRVHWFMGDDRFAPGDHAQQYGHGASPIPRSRRRSREHYSRDPHGCRPAGLGGAPLRGGAQALLWSRSV